MSDKRKMNTADEQSAVSIVRKEKLGVFMKPYKVVKSYGINCMNSHITSYRAGQLITDDKVIEDLLAQGAPIKVYSRDAD